MPKFGEFIFGSSGKAQKLDTLSKDQQQLMKLITQGITSGEGPFGELFGGFNKEQFEKGVKNPALNTFQNEILPQIQEKFIAGNQMLGSGMRRGQLKAATDLQDKLAQLMYQAQQDAQKNKMSGIQSIMGTKTHENIYKPGQGGAVQSFIEGLGKAAGTAIAG